MSNPSYIQPSWPVPAWVKAYSTTRRQGHSCAPFDQFNLAYSVGDDAKIVDQNHQKLTLDLALPSLPYWLTQVHGNQVVYIDEDTTSLPRPQADAAVTRTAQQICAVMTADCLPILLCNQQGTEVAAIHAGWRGLLDGIIASTLQALNSSAASLMAWLGPAISISHFEINESIYHDFIDRNINCISAFRHTDNRYWADLYQIASIHLQTLGVQQPLIFGGEFCTYQQTELFYSYRRDGVTGRMASLIWLEK